MKKFYQLSISAFLISCAGISFATSDTTTPITDISLSFGNSSFEYASDEFHLTQLPDIASQPLSVGARPIQISTEKQAFACGQSTCYPTDIDGVALSLNVDGQPINASAAQPQSITPNAEQIALQGQLVIYKKLASGLYAINSADLLNLSTDSQQYRLHLNNSQLSIKQKTCRLTSEQNQAVHLQTISQRALQQAQRLLGGTFDIRLECDSGVKAKVVFRDQNDLNSQRDYLTLTDDSTATGVGIELRREDNSVIQMGKVWDFAHNHSDNTEITKRDFLAYYRAIGEPSAGSVKSIATISFSYH